MPAKSGGYGLVRNSGPRCWVVDPPDVLLRKLQADGLTPGLQKRAQNPEVPVVERRRRHAGQAQRIAFGSARPHHHSLDLVVEGVAGDDGIRLHGCSCLREQAIASEAGGF